MQIKSLFALPQILDIKYAKKISKDYSNRRIYILLLQYLQIICGNILAQTGSTSVQCRIRILQSFFFSSIFIKLKIMTHWNSECFIYFFFEIKNFSHSKIEYFSWLFKIGWWQNNDWKIYWKRNYIKYLYKFVWMGGVDLCLSNQIC